MKLETVVNGQGYPLLCLHGHPGSKHCMNVFTEPLANHFKTLAPDLRGYGQSRTATPFTMAQHLDDLVELLDRFAVDQCLVLGWSLGGILAMELALRSPATVQGLILVGTAARPRGSHPPISLMDNVVTGLAGAINWVLPGWKGAIALGKKSLFRYLIGHHTPEAYRYLAKEGAPAFLRTSRYAESALYTAIRAGYNRLPDIKTLQMPSLMLCGECDRHITAEASLETARSLPSCQAHCYPETAHLFPWEIPIQMNADIHHWLASQSAIHGLSLTVEGYQTL